MNSKHLDPFLKAVELVLSQIGISDIKKGSIQVKEEMYVDKDITAFIGIVGEIKGNVSYSFDSQTAMKIASAMMMGMPVTQLNEIERSALAELANMITGNAVGGLTDVKDIDITPPSVIMGQDIFFVIGTVSTLTISIETSVGSIEVNFGLETQDNCLGN
ncbi:chemotaxis protein CheX [Acetivibrio cellulolyticus]|uniref:chemotaxis protein CheX n=1 Tax=Acetivibrio cellulolyticus TaxID=35830 RepID=UPI0001E2E35C|nr:chemotaxis protein CheX [Acetivibrio cellulolyticus]